MNQEIVVKRRMISGWQLEDPAPPPPPQAPPRLTNEAGTTVLTDESGNIILTGETS